MGRGTGARVRLAGPVVNGIGTLANGQQIRVGVGGNVINFAASDPNQDINSLQDVKALQQQMGQTGDEAGLVHPQFFSQKLYVATSKSYNINYYLNSDGKSIDSPISNWQNLGYTKNMVKNDIAKIDSGMKPLPRDIHLTRYVNASALSNMLGSSGIDDKNIGSIVSRMKSESNFMNAFQKRLTTTDYTAKAYTSASYVRAHGTFDSMPIRLNIVAKKGTNAIVTNNHREHEIVLGRGQAYKFKGARVESVIPTSTRTRMDQLVIDVEI